MEPVASFYDEIHLYQGTPAELEGEALIENSKTYPIGTTVLTQKGAGVVTDSSDAIEMARVQLDGGDTSWYYFKELDKP